MKSEIQPSLLNDPFGDPGLLVQILLQKQVLLFDLGDLSALSICLRDSASQNPIFHSVMLESAITPVEAKTN